MCDNFFSVAGNLEDNILYIFDFVSKVFKKNQTLY
jgi:hypothetical protein